MSRKTRFTYLRNLVKIGSLLAVLSICVAAYGQRPNLLLIIADDLGYGDLGCTGSITIATPNIDHLAETGVLCTQAYVASSVCSPSRAGLMTGRDPRRFGYENNLNKLAKRYPTRPELLGLPPTEHTIGDHCKAAGYATGYIGKWHLGLEPSFHPNLRGFDYFCGMLGGGHSYFPTPKSHKIVRNDRQVTGFSSPYLTDFFSDEAIRWIDEHASEDQPWLLVLSYNAPHTPMQATDEDLADCQHIKDSKRRTYAAMVRALDRGIGRVFDRLKETGHEDTLTVFLSDNGGATGNASWNGPLSGTKGTLREGGICVPMIWNWPGTLPAGRPCDAVVSSLDILHTFLAAADSEPIPLKPPLSHQDSRNHKRAVEQFGAYDGIDLLPTLAGENAEEERVLYWRLQGQAAVLCGEFKLIRLSHRPPQLFCPTTDPAEQHDLVTTHRNELEDLFRSLGRWEASLTTAPLWDSSPFWWGQSAKNYDNWPPRTEPE